MMPTRLEANGLMKTLNKGFRFKKARSKVVTEENLLISPSS